MNPFAFLTVFDWITPLVSLARRDAIIATHDGPGDVQRLRVAGIRVRSRDYHAARGVWLLGIDRRDIKAAARVLNEPVREREPRGSLWRRVLR